MIVSGPGVPLKRSDVDTDQIIPAEWLKRVERTGFEKGLFSTWRDDRNFVLNDERYAGRVDPRRRSGVRRRLVTRARRVGDPAGRLRRRDRAELLRHLPQQLHEERTRAGRAARAESVERIWAAIDADPTTEIVVDVERLVVEVPAAGIAEPFPMDAPTQHRFLEGLDDVGITLPTPTTSTTTRPTARPGYPDHPSVFAASVCRVRRRRAALG